MKTDEKIFLYDLETTGVLPKPGWIGKSKTVKKEYFQDKPNAIHQISGMILINGKVDKKFDYKVRPFEGSYVDPGAMIVCNIKEEDLFTDEYRPMEEVHADIKKMITVDYGVNPFDTTDKFHLAGFNNRGFDDPFFRTLFERCNDNYFFSLFWGDSLDALVQSSNILKKKRYKMVDFKLKTVAQAFGINVEEEKTHEGSYDVYLTHEIFKKIWAEEDIKMEKSDLITLVRGVWPSECERNNSVFDGFGVYSIGTAEWTWENRKIFENCEKHQLWNMYQVCKESFKKQKTLKTI